MADGAPGSPGLCSDFEVVKLRRRQGCPNAAIPMRWPADKEHDYELWLEKTPSVGSRRAYVTAHPRDNRGGPRSRFAVRLDLPGVYSSKADAEAAAFYIANRYFRRKFAALEHEVSTTVKGYVIIGRARFRIDCHEWEPILWIKSLRSVNRGATQGFEGNASPLYRRTFPTAETAAHFALSYGERVVMGLVGGLHI
jgi:hypothetical protein